MKGFVEKQNTLGGHKNEEIVKLMLDNEIRYVNEHALRLGR